jgi:hypothetical protein
VERSNQARVNGGSNYDSLGQQHTHTHNAFCKGALSHGNLERDSRAPRKPPQGDTALGAMPASREPRRVGGGPLHSSLTFLGLPRLALGGGSGNTTWFGGGRAGVFLGGGGGGRVPPPETRAVNPDARQQDRAARGNVRKGVRLGGASASPLTSVRYVLNPPITGCLRGKRCASEPRWGGDEAGRKCPEEPGIR